MCITVFLFSLQVVIGQDIVEKATNLGAPINTGDYAEYAPTISADGNTLVFESDKEGTWKLYITYKTKTGWTEPELMDNVNSDSFDGGPFMSYDGNYLLITSSRGNGVGSLDIWVSERMGDEWTKPKNMGEPVNTSSYDGFASLTSDGNEIFLCAMPKVHRIVIKIITMIYTHQEK